MKKLLMTLTGVGLFSAQASADSLIMGKTYQGARASHIQFDTRKVNALVQKTADYARDGIIAVLAAAENEGFGASGYNQSAGQGLLKSVAHEKFTGLADGMKVGREDGAIQFVMDPSEIDPGIGIGKYTITYKPFLAPSVAEGSMTDAYIDGWTCETTASTETRLGRGHITHTAGVAEPMFMGLGYPFELCTIVGATPSVAEE